MATSHKYVQNYKHVTYGAELELVDWPRNEPLPVKGMAIDEGAYTNVNSNGVAVDGKGKTYHLGGEILTAPTDTPDGVVEQWLAIFRKWPQTKTNYRMGLNVHVRIPGLQENLTKLKQLQVFTHKVMPTLLPVIDPILVPTPFDYPDRKVLAGAVKNYKTRCMDHHTLLTKERLKLQLKARTPKEFFEAEAVHLDTGKVHWALHARTCVNLRQLLQTDTVEFRHFFMPRNGKELFNTVGWCKLFLDMAFNGGDIGAKDLLNRFKFMKHDWPVCLPYDAWLDEGYHYTSPRYHDATTVKTHIKEWLARHKSRKV